MKATNGHLWLCCQCDALITSVQGGEAAGSSTVAMADAATVSIKRHPRTSGTAPLQPQALPQHVDSRETTTTTVLCYHKGGTAQAPLFKQQMALLCWLLE